MYSIDTVAADYSNSKGHTLSTELLNAFTEGCVTRLPTGSSRMSSLYQRRNKSGVSIIMSDQRSVSHSLANCLSWTESTRSMFSTPLTMQNVALQSPQWWRRSKESNLWRARCSSKECFGVTTQSGRKQLLSFKHLHVSAHAKHRRRLTNAINKQKEVLGERRS